MKVFFTGFFMLLSVLKISAQTKTAVVDTSTVDDRKSSLTVGVNYGNTTNYYGQSTAEKLPYTSFSASYNYKNGLWTSVSAVKLLSSGTGISETSLSAGYDFEITKKLGGSLSYTRSIFPKNSPLPQSINPNSVSSSLSYNWNWFNMGGNGYYVFGNVKDESGNKLTDFFLTFNVSKDLNLGSFSEKDYITITPSIQLTGGTQRLGGMPTSDEEATENNSSNYLTSFAESKKQQIGIPDVIPVPKGAKRLPPNKNGGKNTVIQSTSFDLVTTSFSLPVAYNRAHYTLEAAYQLSIPNKNFEGIVHKNQSFFTLSFFYLFFKDKP